MKELKDLLLKDQIVLVMMDLKELIYLKLLAESSHC